MNPKQRVLSWSFHRFKIRPPLRIAHAKFLQEVTPLKLKLAACHIELA